MIPVFAPKFGLAGVIAGLFAAGEQGAWYDPSDLSTLFQDSAGTVPVTAVEQPVGLILDKSGRGNHATQATATSRPVLQQDASGRYYMSFDGVDDWMLTNSIDFTATDKMTVFAGSRYFGDAAGTLCELSVNANSNHGAFGCYVSDNSAGREAVSGRALGVGVGGIYITAPKDITRVTTRQIDFAQPTPETEFAMRVNGVTQTPVFKTPASAGTGNFGNYPLFIGRRGGATFPFNGRIYSLIIRGAQSTAQQIASAEAWVNTKTGAY